MLKIEIVAEDDVSVSGSPNEYSQVILNILINIKDAIPERQVAQPWVEVKLFREDGMTVVAITDNAGGIAEDIMDKIFDRTSPPRRPTRERGSASFGVGGHCPRLDQRSAIPIQSASSLVISLICLSLRWPTVPPIFSRGTVIILSI